MLKGYAERDNVQDISDQMKTFPTNAGLEIRFNSIGEQFKEIKSKFKAKFSTKNSLDEGLESVRNHMKDRFLNKNDFKSEFMKIEKQIGE